MSYSLVADEWNVGQQGLFENFYLYFWRSLESPGIRYLARSASAAEAMSRELMQEGYIVKVVHAATDTEYAWRQGALLPVGASLVPA